jgi:osmotically-inducible protein OsmY
MKRLLTVMLLSLALTTMAWAGQSKEKPTGPQKGTPIEKPAAGPVDDATLVTNVKARISRTPSLKDYAIDVAAKDGVVTLKGTVKSGSHKGVATRVVQSVQGVKKVENQIATEKQAGAATKGEGEPKVNRKGQKGLEKSDAPKKE